jgi:hypothetical protein
VKNFPDEKRQTEILKEIEIAEHKAREMAEFADKIATKWENKMAEKRATKQKVSETN